MKKLLSILFFLLFTALIGHAQEVRKAQPDSVIKIIPVGEGKYASYLYTIGGKLQTPEDIKIRLLNYAPSASEFSRAKTNLVISYISTVGFAASSFAALIEFKNNAKDAGVKAAIVNEQAVFIYQQHSHTGAYIFTGLATAFLTTSIINFIKAAKHGQRALKLYNQRFE